MTNYYADVMPDGRVRACLKWDGVPHAPIQPQGDLVLLDGPLDWRAPTETSVLKIIEGAQVWVETATLDEIKARKSSEITAAYLLANDTSFKFAEKEIQADAHAMKQINVTSSGIMRRGALVSGWPGYWKALDNTYVPIPDVATWWAMCDAIEATGHANFKKAQELKAAIGAATTAEQVAAIQWNQPTGVA